MATLTTLVATGQTPVMAQTVGGNTTKVAMDAPSLHKVVGSDKLQETVDKAKKLGLTVTDAEDVRGVAKSEAEITTKSEVKFLKKKQKLIQTLKTIKL